MSVTANKDYTFSTYVKTDNVTATGTNGAGMYVKFYDASNNEIANSAQRSDTVKGTNGWQRINFTFTTPAGAVKARVFLVLMSATGTAYFDCAQLEGGNTVNDYNMLQNSSFDSAKNWSRIGLDTAGDGVDTTAGKLHITGSATENRSAYQRVQINRQKTSFTFSAIAQGNSVPLTDETRTFGIKLKIYYSDGSFSEEIAYFNTATSAEQKASATAMIPEGKKDLTIDYVIYYLIYNNNANSVEFDNCMLTFDETGTSYVYDENGNIVRSYDNAGGSSTYLYNENNEVTNYTNGNSSSYSYTYSSEEEHKITGSYSHQTYNGVVYDYDEYGNIDNVKFGAVDSDGQLRVSNSVVANEKYIQNETDYTAYMKDENGDYIYDENGNKVVDEQKSGNYVTSETDQQNKTTIYNVDQVSGLTESVLDAKGNMVSYTYYEDSFLPHTVTSGDETIRYSYDNCNRLSAITHNDFEYEFNYDEFGNTTSITVADRILIANTYGENNGVLEEKEYGNGTEYTYTYDDYGRVTSVAVNGTTKFNTVYNKKGQVSYIYDIANDRKLVYTYDVSGRVIGVTYTDVGSISTTYDGSDRITSVTYDYAGQTKTVSFIHAVDGLKGIATLVSGDQKTTTYDELNREVSSEVANLESKTTYKDIDEEKTTTLVESLTYNYDDTQLFSESYTYDALGNIRTSTQNGVTVTYSYDELNQLTRASSTDGTVTKYFYNDGGNINYKVNVDGSKTHYVYDSQWKDLLVGFGGQTITYDTIGNPIVYRDGMNFGWTGRQLDTVTINGSTNISYAYDMNGIRINKTVGNVTTEYFLDGSTIVAEKTGDNVIWYMYDVDGKILGFTYNDTAYYYVKNLQGDVVQVIDTNGTVVASYTYDPWGKLLNTTGSMAEINPIRYRGYYYDVETGLYYLNSRYYDPETCRFINADGYLTTGQGVLSYNMFAYCLNNPINNVDPSGQLCLLIKYIKDRLEKIGKEIRAVVAEVKRFVELKSIGVEVKVETDSASGDKSIVVTNSYKITNKFQQIWVAAKVIKTAKANDVDLGYVTGLFGIVARWDSYNALYDMGVYKSVTGSITFGRDDLMAHNYFVDMGKNNGYSYIPDFLLLDSVECVGVKSYAQQQNYTCGSASARMVLEYLGVKKDGKYISEMDIWNFANLCKHNYVCTCNCDCIWDCDCNCNWKCDCNCECYESLSSLDDYSDKGVSAAGTGYEQITRALNVFIDKSAKSNHEYAHFSDQVFGRYYAPKKTNSTLDYQIYAGFLIGSLKKGCPVIIKIYIPYDDAFFNYGFNSYHYVVVTGLQKISNDDYMVTIHDPWAPGLDEGVVRTLRMSELREYNDGDALGIMIYGRR